MADYASGSIRSTRWGIARRRSNSALDDISFKGLPLLPAQFTLARCAGFVGAIACFASLAAALAGEPTPVASIKTRTFEARVFLDDKIEADAALSADCLAEGQKWMAKNAAEAEASRKQDPQLFREGGWTFERRYNSRSLIDGRYVSIVRSDYMDTHGAHPNSDVDTILWDAASRKRISIRPFFAETADNGPTMKAMLKGVIASLNIEKKKRAATETATAEWYKSLEPKLLKIGAVTLAPSTETDKSSGLTFHYPPYAVGPYAEGEYVAYVPWEALKPYLTPEGTKIFGGARPNGDDDGPQ
jgi:hypothetical protein